MELETDQVDLSSPGIPVRIHAGTISDKGLVTIYAIAQPAGQPSDKLRAWVRDVISAESRRRSGDNPELIEPSAWVLPWHSFDDQELSDALAASYSWLDLISTFDVENTLKQIHRAVVVAASARLVELDGAIRIAKRRGQK